MELFGSPGIRGIANREVTPELALNLGLAVGSEPKIRITVEARRSGKKLYKMSERIVREAL